MLRHTLLAFGEEPPAEPTDLFGRIEALTGAEAAAFQAVYDYHEGRPERKIPSAYDGYMHALEKVIVALDGMVPKTEWKRVRSRF